MRKWSALKLQEMCDQLKRAVPPIPYAESGGRDFVRRGSRLLTVARLRSLSVTRRTMAFAGRLGRMVRGCGRYSMRKLKVGKT
jgi:hypothetical protein